MENTWLNINQYDAIRISEYKGKFAIQKARRGEEKNFVEWICPLRYNKEAGESTPALKNDGDYLYVPLQIPLGNQREKAAEVLRALYFQLMGERIADDKEMQQPESPIEDDDPPF